MIGKINETLCENERISYLWWGTGVRKRFKQLYPGNKLILLLDSSLVTMLLCFILLVKFWVFSSAIPHADSQEWLVAYLEHSIRVVR